MRQPQAVPGANLGLRLRPPFTAPFAESPQEPPCVPFPKAVHCLRAERDSDCCYWILYSGFSLLAFAWLPLAAALTLRSRSWMTR